MPRRDHRQAHEVSGDAALHVPVLHSAVQCVQAVRDRDLEARPAVEDRLELFAPAESPYLCRAGLRVADLGEETFVLREPGSATREAVLRCLSARGVAPTKTLQMGSNEAVKRAVAAGLGVSVLSAQVLDVDLRAGDVALLRCAHWDCRRRFWLVHRRDRLLSPAEQAFLHLL